MTLTVGRVQRRCLLTRSQQTPESPVARTNRKTKDLRRMTCFPGAHPSGRQLLATLAFKTLALVLPRQSMFSIHTEGYVPRLANHNRMKL